MPFSVVSKVEFAGMYGTWVANLVKDSSKNLKAEDLKKLTGNEIMMLPSLNNLSRYNLALQLKYLPKGTYSINVEFCGINAATGYEIQIK